MQYMYSSVLYTKDGQPYVKILGQRYGNTHLVTWGVHKLGTVIYKGEMKQPISQSYI